MPIWFSSPTLEVARATSRDNAIEHLGIEVTEIGDDFIRATMPVDHRTVQPFRILHGGASVLLAETLGSLASMLVLDPSTGKQPFGIEINANHLRAVKEGGRVVGTVRPIHLGRTTHVWDIRVETEDGRPVCVSRLTVAVVSREA